MAKEFTINEGFNPQGQAKLIIKGFGLGLLKPAFYNIDVFSDKALKEATERIEGDKNINQSMFGLPVFDTLEFDKLDYEDLDGNKPHIDPLTLGTVLIEISQSKNIVTTSIQGRNGTVKEYISDGDYQIMIKGVLVGFGNEVNPQDLKSQLIAFCKAPVEFAVASNLFEGFGIKSIVIKDYNFPQIEGQRNTVPFELTCLSDQPIELKSQSLS
jgi:Domain of unknown function (DUF6046)